MAAKKIIQHWSVNDGKNMSNHGKCVRFVGAPDDRGVMNVGGRLGAGKGPEAIRALFSQFLLGINGDLGKVTIQKGVNTALGSSIEEAHGSFRGEIKKALENGVTPIALGGGHDYGYPHVAGASDFFGKEKIALINVDPHLDVRPVVDGKITSGSPFFLTLEEGVVLPKNFIEFGIQPHANDKKFAEYLTRKKVKIIMLDEARAQNGGVVAAFEKIIKDLARKKFKIVVSFDVDSVIMSSAPGVSAPQADGFSAAEFLRMAEICGQQSSVASIGFFETAPDLDSNLKTVRLVATAIHRYVSAVGSKIK